MKGEFVSYIVIVLCIYFLVFNFPLTPLGVPVGTKNLLYLFLLLVMLLYGKKYMASFKHFGKEFLLLLIPLMYVLFRTLMGGDSVFVTKHITGLLDTFFVPLAILLYAAKSGITTENKFIRCILILGAVASVISLLSFIFPPVQAYIKYNILNLQPETALYWNNNRGFGLAMSLTSSYAYIQGIIFVLGCFYAKENKWFLFFLPLVLLSVITNARTGLLILTVGVIIFIVSKKTSFASVFFGIVVFVMIINLQDIMQSFGVSSEIVGWISVLFNDMDVIYATGDINQSYTGNRLFDTMWILPETSSEWLFGKGYSLFRHELEENSDNGWILQLNYGGIIYMILLYFFVIPIISGLRKSKKLSLAVFFLAIILIVNTKSSLFPNNEVFRFLMIIYMYFMLLNRKSVNKPSEFSYDKTFLRSV